MSAMPVRARVLVLEEDPGNRRLVASILRSAGHEVFEAEHAAAAPLLVAATRVDLVVAQATLVGLEELFAAPHVAPPPLILMSPALSGEMRDRMRALGALCSVHRPVFVDELRAAVTRALTTTPRRHRPALPCVDETAAAS
jgi:DNA-binding response OmpR family regulator